MPTQLEPIGQIILQTAANPRHVLDPLRYQIGRARQVIVNREKGILPPRDTRLETVAAWMDWHNLHIVNVVTLDSQLYRIIIGRYPTQAKEALT